MSSTRDKLAEQERIIGQRVRPEVCTTDCTWPNCTCDASAEQKRRMIKSTLPFASALSQSDGSTASYYELPPGTSELQELIAFRDMNAQIGEIFRACYRYGRVAHSPKIRDIKKIIFYAQAELDRLEKYES